MWKYLTKDWGSKHRDPSAVDLVPSSQRDGRRRIPWDWSLNAAIVSSALLMPTFKLRIKCIELMWELYHEKIAEGILDSEKQDMELPLSAWLWSTHDPPPPRLHSPQRTKQFDCRQVHSFKPERKDGHVIHICNKQAFSQGGACRLSVKNLYFSIGAGIVWGLPWTKSVN